MNLDRIERLIARGGWKEDATLRNLRPSFGPRNTWSNLAYALAGFLCFLAAPSNETGVLWFTMTVLALGSGLYHHHKTAYFNAWDHNGMYATFGALAAFGWGGPAWLMAAVGLFFAWIGTYWCGQARLDTQVGFLLVVGLFPMFLSDPGFALVVLAIYALGFAVQRLDKAKSPLVGLWGHALWHVITALAIGLSILHYAGWRSTV